MDLRPEIFDQLLPYNGRLDHRDPGSIDLIVMHCTELPTLAQAREQGEKVLYENSQTGASGHFYVDRDGAIHRYVTDDRVAHHCVGFNDHSIGIELVNSGRYPKWFRAAHQAMTEPYEDALIAGLVGLLAFLSDTYPRIERIAAHADLDRRLIPAEDDPETLISRRLDPGPQFPWAHVLERTGLTRFIPE